MQRIIHEYDLTPDDWHPDNHVFSKKPTKFILNNLEEYIDKIDDNSELIISSYTATQKLIIRGDVGNNVKIIGICGIEIWGKVGSNCHISTWNKNNIKTNDIGYGSYLHTSCGSIEINGKTGDKVELYAGEDIKTKDIGNNCKLTAYVGNIVINGDLGKNAEVGAGKNFQAGHIDDECDIWVARKISINSSSSSAILRNPFGSKIKASLLTQQAEPCSKEEAWNLDCFLGAVGMKAVFNENKKKNELSNAELITKNSIIFSDSSGNKEEKEVKKASMEKVNEEIPETFVCPITRELMKDPVIAEDGYTYERKAILEWLRKNPTSPITRESMNADILISNRAIKDQIEVFNKPNGGIGMKIS